MPQNLDFRGVINTSVSKACGYNLDEFILDNIYKPRAGEVYALPAGALKAKHILLGIMPYYRDNLDRNDAHLSGLVRKIMELGRCMLLSDIAFPPLASGNHGFPKPRSARLVLQGVVDRMEESISRVQIVCNSQEMVDIYQQKLDVYKT